MCDNTIGISRAALSHEQSIPSICSSSWLHRAALREKRIQQLLESVQLLERAVPTHMLVLRIAASFIAFDDSSAAARAGDVE